MAKIILMQWLALILVLPYFWILLSVYRGLKKINTFCPNKPGNQKISVIVACRNESENIPLLLNDLAAQSYPPDLFEVIIIDDNSSDNSYGIASSFGAIKNLTVLRNNGEGKKSAIRTGVIAAKGSLIITTDADCRIKTRWLETISSFSDSSGAVMIVCPVILEEGKGFSGKFAELEFLSLQGVTAGTLARGSGVMCNGANLAFTREAYLSNMENIHTEIPSGDDVFLLHSMKNSGGLKIEWLESIEAVVRTSSPLSSGNFFRQRGRWISKATAYNDTYTIILGIVTFVTILMMLIIPVAALFDYTYIYVYFAILILKSIPDYLILGNTTERYGKRKLMSWFLPSQFFYPIYVLISVFYGYICRQKWH
ncbi:MAG: glycosyltransferase [Bacteroidetes bacterium]|nr:glycosyltransferase [Bacteroidota bacterium]